LEGDFASQLASPDPKNRYLAVNSLSHPDAAQTAPLLKAIETEQEWVIKRRIVLALGRSSSPDAVPVLKRLAGDSKAKLSVAAKKDFASNPVAKSS
jgi:HEAT repeat protein